ncbi:MAG TPA: phosphoribosylformylglycinamidine cyclo-ligase, partial [Clostridiales bacterium]|nr:phosphoribosylformylglycinamidine cyclo-ligase [Clostridiales bacterium]
DMYNTFNMGAGLVVAVPAEQADRALQAIAEAGETGYIIGRCEAGEKEVRLW